MQEIIEITKNVWQNLVLGGRFNTLVFSIIAFLVFYHWSFYKLTKLNFSILKANLIILVALIVFKITFFIMQFPYRSATVRSEDLFYFFADIIQLSAIFIVYTFFYIQLLKKEIHINKALGIILLFFCFYFYFTEFAIYVRYGWDDHVLFRVIWNFILAITATSLDSVFRYVFKLQQIKDNQAKMENLKLREQIVKSQYEVLHAKVNPHFLYNSLNSIAGLAALDGEKTKKMALSLSRYFKYSINREAQNTISIKEEIEMVNTYLEIEKIRFEDRLQYSISAVPETLNTKIPRLLLQPLVENSVKHGQNLKDYTIDITVEIQKTDNKLVIMVKDKGKPYDEKIKPGYGLKSVYDKLDLFCPGNYEISLVNSPAKAMEIIIEL